MGCAISGSGVGKNLRVVLGGVLLVSNLNDLVLASETAEDTDAGLGTPKYSASSFVRARLALPSLGAP
jgi:hypothetical protein